MFIIIPSFFLNITIFKLYILFSLQISKSEICHKKNTYNLNLKFRLVFLLNFIKTQLYQSCKKVTLHNP